MCTSLGAMLLAQILTGCAHVTNVAMCTAPSGGPSYDCSYDPDPRAVYRYAPKSDRDTLVVVTMSGGGMRAAALSYGALQMLQSLPGVRSGTLVEDVDLVSSVSGGSVTAAWYALHGRAGLQDGGDDPMWQFLHHDWTPELAWRGLNPVALAKYAFTSYQRSDTLSQFFADKLFGNATYKDILNRYVDDPRQPFVILNATDLGHETGFAFTQGTFDMLCSDLNAYRVADAVSASANFPLAFSAIGLRNYSTCPAQTSARWIDAGPPQWLAHYDQFDDASTPAPRSYQLSQLRAARQARDRISPDPDDRYLHLLDGGLIDNLGVRSTLALEDDPARMPGLYLRLGGLRPHGYENIRRILYIVINARTRDPASIDRRIYPPGAAGTTKQMIFTQLDNSILADQDYLTAELEAIANRRITTPSQEPPRPPFLSNRTEAAQVVAAPAGPLEFYIVTVDFEMIPDRACRDHYWALGTNWGLEEKEVDKLIAAAKVILSRSRDLAEFYRSIDRPLPSELTRPMDFSVVCGKSRQAATAP